MGILQKEMAAALTGIVALVQEVAGEKEWMRTLGKDGERKKVIRLRTDNMLNGSGAYPETRMV